ncbi:MAG: hypothetical protein ABWY16_17160 [Pedobacter sp.]|jgi:hypothetical protein|uniref:hypothetical protein n=1 Tax=Pedobacter sp. TaxID=1411316 RepID=UPI0033932DB0
MTLISSTDRILLRAIAITYILLFIMGLACSGYFLKEILALKPIPLIGLLKYLLLCVLFVILLVNCFKALSLKPQHLARFYQSTTNFRWLFMISLLISAAAKLSLFDTALHKQVAVSYLHIGILMVLGIFCFWSDGLLKKTEA